MGFVMIILLRLRGAIYTVGSTLNFRLQSSFPAYLAVQMGAIACQKRRERELGLDCYHVILKFMVVCLGYVGLLWIELTSIWTKLRFSCIYRYCTSVKGLLMTAFSPWLSLLAISDKFIPRSGEGGEDCWCHRLLNFFFLQ